MTGCSLYRFYDAEGQLLYVGITSVGPSRWIGHEQHRTWWALTVRTTVEHFPTRPEASAAERVAIATERPIHNIQHRTPRTERVPAVKGKHGLGTIIKRDDGRWAFVCNVAGRRRWMNTRTEGEAELLRSCFVQRGVSRLTRDKAIAILQAGPDWDGTLPKG